MCRNLTSVGVAQIWLLIYTNTRKLLYRFSKTQPLVLGAPVYRVAWARTPQTVHIYSKTSPGSNPDTNGLDAPLGILFFSSLQDEAEG
jgi:predicted component of type VI protein secretion system